MFDEIFWTFIDPRFFAPSTTIEDRLGLLCADEREGIDGIVEKKLSQASEGNLNLISHYSIDGLLDL